MLSILIVNWNTRSDLLACLQALRENPPQIPFETIVVDNGSTDASAEAVVALFPEVALISAGGNTGYARGNNLAFQVAKGDWLLTLNPDTEVRPGALQRAVETLAQLPEAGALGAKLVGRDGKTQASVRGFPSFVGILGDVTGLGRWLGGRWDSYRLTKMDLEASQWVDQPMGTFLLFRREALMSVGDPSSPFDEQFPIFFNEVDLLKRLRDAGWKCWYESSVVITHVGGASTRQVRKPMIWESHRSLMRYLKKHQRNARWALPVVGFFVTIAALIRAKGFSEGFRPQHSDL